MKIKQTNLNNSKGFDHQEDTNFGKDEKGNLAQGYQHTDALLWHNSPAEDFFIQTISNYYNWRSGQEEMFKGIATNLVNYFNPKTVLDLGCGSGLLMKYVRELSPKTTTVTVDANQQVVNSPYIDQNHFVGRTDQKLIFVDDQNNPVKFDLITSLEHLEHVSEDGIDIYMQNVVDHSKIGTRFIFSVHLYAYGDEEHKHVHCNVKSVEYWIEKMASYGFEKFESQFTIGRSDRSMEGFFVKTK